jgi:hypothetical protein
MAGGGFRVEPSALIRQADAFWTEARLFAYLVNDLAGTRAVDSGDGELNALVTHRLDELISALAAAGVAMQATADGLGTNAARYVRADQAGEVGGSQP